MKQLPEPVRWRKKERLLAGFPRMTWKMFVVIYALAYADAQEWNWEPLYDVHHSTLQALIGHEWIYADDGLDGTRYRITSAGLAAFNAYNTPQPERGLCPRCHKNERHIFKTGRRAAYCADCLKKVRAGAARLKRPTSRPDRPCSRCHKRPRHVSKKGIVSTWCSHCKKVMSKKSARKSIARRYARIHAGEVILCADCHAEPVYVCGKTAYSYCYEHYTARQQAARNRSRKA